MIQFPCGRVATRLQELENVAQMNVATVTQNISECETCHAAAWHSGREVQQLGRPTACRIAAARMKQWRLQSHQAPVTENGIGPV